MLFRKFKFKPGPLKVSDSPRFAAELALRGPGLNLNFRNNNSFCGKEGGAIGEECENFVVEKLEESGREVVFRNLRFFGVEIDIVVRSLMGELVFVEVKSLSDEKFWHFRLGNRQKKRLLRAAEAFSQKMARPVSLYLALVQPGEKKIVWIPLRKDD